jgi:hypothetical protein
MARDILGEYGSESSQPQRPRASSGGIMPVRDVRGYQPPQGPTNINDPCGPGIHGGNHGNANCFYPDADDSRGSPGLHGTNRGNKGSQR